MKYLGYIFVFYVGFYFFRLAENHNKRKWLFGFVGIIIFIIGYFLYLLYCRFFNSLEFNTENKVSISIKAFISGLLFSYLLFQILSFIWAKKKKKYNSDVDEIGKIKD